MMLTKGDVAKALWVTLVHCYNQGGRTKVELPVDEEATILCALLANVLSQAPRPERRRIEHDVPRRISNMMQAAGKRQSDHIWSKGNNLVLP